MVCRPRFVPNAPCQVRNVCGQCEDIVFPYGRRDKLLGTFYGILHSHNILRVREKIWVDQWGVERIGAIDGDASTCLLVRSFKKNEKVLGTYERAGITEQPL